MGVVFGDPIPYGTRTAATDLGITIVEESVSLSLFVLRLGILRERENAVSY